MGRIAIARGSERQHLPSRLAAVGELTNETICFITQVSYPKGGRQGCGMKKNAAAARQIHETTLSKRVAGGRRDEEKGLCHVMKLWFVYVAGFLW